MRQKNWLVIEPKWKSNILYLISSVYCLVVCINPKEAGSFGPISQPGEYHYIVNITK